MKQLDSNGVKVGEEIKVNLNLATSYYQYASTQYYPVYQDAKRNAHMRYEHLKQWKSLDMIVDNVVAMNSHFVDSIVRVEREDSKEDEQKKKDKSLDQPSIQVDFRKQVDALRKGVKVMDKLSEAFNLWDTLKDIFNQFLAFLANFSKAIFIVVVIVVFIIAVILILSAIIRPNRFNKYKGKDKIG